MDVFAGLNSTMLMAAAGGLGVVIVIALVARSIFGAKKDEVIERLERATNGGMDMGAAVERDRPEKTFARIAAILRPFAKLVKPSGARIVAHPSAR